MPTLESTDADQDLWAKKGDNYYNSGYNIFFEPTHNNYVKWLHDGAEAMYEMCDAILNAKKFIYLIDFVLSPGIHLVRGDYYTKIISNNKKNQEVINTLRQVKSMNNTKGIKEDVIPLISLLAVKALEGVKVRIILFSPTPDQDCSTQSGYNDVIRIINQWSDRMDIVLASWGNNNEGHIIGGHHQKSLVVETNKGLIAFCGGVDMAYARWQLPSHNVGKDPIDISSRIEKQFKISSQMGWIDLYPLMGEWNDDNHQYEKKGSQVLWHDTHVKVVGNGAYHLAWNFYLRYKAAVAQSFPSDDPSEIICNEVKNAKITSDPNLLSPSEDYSKDDVYTQVLRTYSPDNDYGVLDAYRNLFGKAKRNIYVESQYAFQDEELLLILLDNLRKNKELKVIIVAPLMPDSYDSVINSALTSLMEESKVPANANENSYRVLICSLMTNYAQKRIPIYVHSKMAIIDDEWSIIGSANLDELGMGRGIEYYPFSGSAEICLLVHGRPQSLALRNKLVQEHLGPFSPTNPDNFEEVFSSFDALLAKNQWSNSKGPVVGHLVKHRAWGHL